MLWLQTHQNHSTGGPAGAAVHFQYLCLSVWLMVEWHVVLQFLDNGCENCRWEDVDHATISTLTTANFSG